MTAIARGGGREHGGELDGLPWVTPDMAEEEEGAGGSDHRRGGSWIDYNGGGNGRQRGGKLDGLPWGTQNIPSRLPQWGQQQQQYGQPRQEEGRQKYGQQWPTIWVGPGGCRAARLPRDGTRAFTTTARPVDDGGGRGAPAQCHRNAIFTMAADIRDGGGGRGGAGVCEEVA